MVSQISQNIEICPCISHSESLCEWDSPADPLDQILGKPLSSCCAPRQDSLVVSPKIRRLWVRILPKFLLPGYNHLLITSTEWWPDTLIIGLALASEGSSVLVVSRWLRPGNWTFSEVANIVITWWIAAFFALWMFRWAAHNEDKT